MLAAFPYVNGGLFDGDDIEIPPFTDEIMDLLLRKASDDFDWSEISPTIFGAVFESTLNPETRRSGGMHYTSIENIHKVIDPLFLDDLKAEFEEIKGISVLRTQEKKLHALQDKLASLSFLDPSAGSGNFLTESYLQLRKLENEILRILTHGQIQFGYADMTPIKVSISQFYGIEINDFAVTVARTALWIAENQMLKETEDIVHMQLDFLPLKTNAYIVEGNALRINWNDVVPKEKLNYIMGNPPFVGYSYQSESQKEDILSIYVDENGKPYKTAGKIDYVAGWYWKASEMMQGTKICTALVSTNSITQGEQVASIWKPLYQRFGIHIDFAYRTFVWDSEASLKAHVHCVIIGFSAAPKMTKRIVFSDRTPEIAVNISPYLIDAPVVLIESRKKPICNVPEMTTGNRPADGGHLIIEDGDYAEFVKKDPASKKYIKRLIGSSEFINNKKRWCLWLVDVSPSEIRKMPEVMKRVEACRIDRENAPDPGRRKLAERPTQFRETNNPNRYIVIPAVSSERRRYIPIGFLDGNTIATNLVITIPNASLLHFGILISNVHMAWMRAVCGRLKSDYRYSKDIVYNNFPWPSPTDEQKTKIEATAQRILDTRALYPDSSLADLYDPLTMPPELRKAHTANDRAVTPLCPCRNVPEKEAEDAIITALNRLPEERDELIRMQGALKDGEIRRIDATIENIAMQEERIHDFLDKLGQEEEGPEFTQAEFLNSELERLEEERTRLIFDRADAANKEVQIRLLLELVDSMKEAQEARYGMPKKGTKTEMEESPACFDSEDFFRRTKYTPESGILGEDGKVQRFSNDMVIRYLESIDVQEDGYAIH